VDLRLEHHELDMNRSFVGAAVAACLVASLIAPPLAVAAGELVKNGLFSAGKDGVPASWTNEGYATDKTTTRFEWTVDELGIGTAGIVSVKPNDARWVQNVPVSPGTWYRIAGWVRTQDVGSQTMGAYLSVMDTFNNSRELRGTNDWQEIDLWMKTSSLDTSLKVACRLGGYSSLNTGTAYFTGISVEAAGVPAQGQSFVYGGSASDWYTERPIWVQVVAVMVVIGVALIVWRYVLPPSSRIPS
jgi:hypothetical protein